MSISNAASLLTRDPEYGALFRSDSTYAFGEDAWKTCRTAAMYAVFGRRVAVEPHVVAAVAGRRSDPWVRSECLDTAYHLEESRERWTCLYIGEVATNPRTRRSARDRFRHEFALAGYFQQAPVLSALCALLYRSQGWRPISTPMGATKTRTQFASEDKAAFLAWCKQNLRYAWVPVAVDVSEAKEKVRADEEVLIARPRPVLNVRHTLNPFGPFVTEARRQFVADGLPRRHSNAPGSG